MHKVLRVLSTEGLMSIGSAAQRFSSVSSQIVVSVFTAI